MSTKRKYILVVRNGYGEVIRQDINARTVYEALIIAKNYCTAHYYSTGWLYSPNGKSYIV